VSALFFFHGAPPAKIARTGAEAKCLPCAAEKNAPLKVSDYCLYFCLRLKVYQYRSMVTIQNLTHLVRSRRKRRANQTPAETIAAELTLQSHPAGSYHV
jgi:hypothetical protein